MRSSKNNQADNPRRGENFSGDYLEEKAKRKQAEEAGAAVKERQSEAATENAGKGKDAYFPEAAVSAATVIRDAGKPWDGKVKKQEVIKKKTVHRHSPAQLQDLIEKVELRIREQEAMLGWLDKQISIPENQLDLEKSRAMAAEREEYVKTIDSLVQKWEELLEEQDALEAEE